MTFNIRYGTAKDGENEWSARRDMLFDVIRSESRSARPPGGARLSDRRNHGCRSRLRRRRRGAGRWREKGEYSAILFKRDRFHVAEAGTFWFSDTPSVVASKSWGNQITRICTWARFIDRDGRAFYHFNLHLDHQSQPSRERSAVLLRGRIDTRGGPGSGDRHGRFQRRRGESGARDVDGADRDRDAAAFLDTFRVLYPGVKDGRHLLGFQVRARGGRTRSTTSWSSPGRR